MQTRIVVYPYKMGSKGGKDLAIALGAPRIFPDKDFHPRDGDFIVDWGCGWKPNWASELAGKNIVLLNHWENVSDSVNKISSFSRLKKAGVSTPPWTLKEETAMKWLNEGHWVCCRQNVEGKDGAGLTLAKKPNQMVHASLYTRYMPIRKEFRVYVYKDHVIDIREKRRDSEALAAGKVNEDIRTESGNWVFCQYGVHAPKGMNEVAIAAVEAMGLDFAGVDVIQAKEDDLCYVLETNTAPYVGDKTVSILAQLIQKDQKKFIQKFL